MSEKPETKFRRKFTARLKQLKNIDITSLQQISLIGDPDHLIILNSWGIALEYKKDGLGVIEDATPLQQKKLRDIQTKGKGGAFVVTPASADYVFRILQRIDNGGLPPWVAQRP